tara:strand:+ start:631 stop:897 length:267 start_codon:yes stop_codon:yes gene_type:complete
MAITLTRTVQRVETYPPMDSTAADDTNAKHPTLMVVYNDLFDDVSDDQLPVTATKVSHFSKYVEDGGAATDMSGEDALVQTIATAIWA